MNNLHIFILYAMLFLHIIADWILQTDKMASLKQRSTWEKYGDQYKYDYIAVLLTHSFCWAFCVCVPCLWISKNMSTFSFAIILNTIIHFYIDDSKANRFVINLLEDQMLHIIQIVSIWLVYIAHIK